MTGQVMQSRLSGSGVLRMLLVCVFVLTGLALLALTLASALRFASPSAVFTEVGYLEAFPPSNEPYEIHSAQARFYLVNTGETQIAQVANHPQGPYCPIFWIQDEHIFRDLCKATSFNFDGSYKSGPPATMQRYPVVVDQGVVRVDFSRVLPGPELVLPQD